MFSMKFRGKITEHLEQLERRMPEIADRAAQLASDILLQTVREEVDKFAKHQTGKLKNSFTAIVRSKGGSKTVVLRSSVPYAQIHDKGGTITAKGKLLTVPVTARARAAKTTRRFSGRLFRKGSVLMQSGGSGGGATTHFVLKRSVRMPAKKYLQKTRARARPKILRRLNRMVGTTVKRSGV